MRISVNNDPKYQRIDQDTSNYLPIIDAKKQVNSVLIEI